MREGSILNSPIKAVNIGAKLLGDALRDQEVEVIHIDWRPPKIVVLDPRIAEILDQLE